MDTTKKYIKRYAYIDNLKISYFIRDNRAKRTMLFIHGLNSSADTIDNLWDKFENVNLIALNLPGSKYTKTDQTLDIEFFINITNQFIDKYIKAKKIILMGHSLGGGVVLGVSKNPKVEELVLVATINPEMRSGSLFRSLKSIHSDFAEPNKLRSIVKSNVLRKFVSTYEKYTKNHWLKAFYDPKSPFYIILTRLLFDDEYMQIKLRKQYLHLNKKCLYLIGDTDAVVDTISFKKFVEETLFKKINIIQNAGHNPFNDQPDQVANLFNKEFPSQRRSLFKHRLINTKAKK